MTPSPRRRCAKRREYIADQKTKNTGLHESIAHVMRLCEKHGAKYGIRFEELPPGAPL